MINRSDGAFVDNASIKSKKSVNIDVLQYFIYNFYFLKRFIFNIF